MIWGWGGVSGPQTGWSSPGGRGLKGTSCWGRRPSLSDPTGKCDIRGGSKGERQREFDTSPEWLASPDWHCFPLPLLPPSNPGF